MGSNKVKRLSEITLKTIASISNNAKVTVTIRWIRRSCWKNPTCTRCSLSLSWTISCMVCSSVSVFFMSVFFMSVFSVSVFCVCVCLCTACVEYSPCCDNVCTFCSISVSHSSICFRYCKMRCSIIFPTFPVLVLLHHSYSFVFRQCAINTINSKT